MGSDRDLRQGPWHSRLACRTTPRGRRATQPGTWTSKRPYIAVSLVLYYHRAANEVSRRRADVPAHGPGDSPPGHNRVHHGPTLGAKSPGAGVLFVRCGFSNLHRSTLLGAGCTTTIPCGGWRPLPAEYCVVGREGVEPSWSCLQRILSYQHPLDRDTTIGSMSLIHTPLYLVGRYPRHRAVPDESAGLSATMYVWTKSAAHLSAVRAATSLRPGIRAA